MTKGPGRGRGMLQIETWVPCRRPGQPRDTSIKPVNISELVKGCKKEREEKRENPSLGAINGSADKASPTPPTNPVQLVAKYNYKANPNKPGGFEEMSLTAGEKLTFVAAHPVNPYWWEAKTESGNVAYIPASYVMVLEGSVKSLPWLDEKKAEKAKEVQENTAQTSVTPVFKTYSSAYSKAGTDSAPTKATSISFYCEVCDKTLNGPKPYQAHMVSKAHKDEVEAAAAYS